MLFIIAILAAIVAFVVYKAAKQRGQKQESTYALMGIFAALLIAFAQIWTVIPAGNVGVIDFFGNVSDKTLSPGVSLVNPLAKVVKFDARTQEIREVMDVPSKEGLSVQLEISLLYSLNVKNANKIYKTVGEEYVSKIVVPQFRSVVRGVTSLFDAQALYTGKREKLQSMIRSDLEKVVGARGINIEATPLRRIILPSRLTAAIEEKLKADQESQRMQFVLKKETQEADRKRIEAKGIADFQNIVSRDITDKLLKWKGIEATENLAKSTNAKIVVIGAGKNGLPLILN
ncbi:MAG TPA: prohibitin family protein [Ignavibacteria bacterium]|nr:prohibitin family protein [Ignavibacteria bacterium]